MKSASKTIFLGVQGIILRTFLIVAVVGLVKDDTVGSCIQHCYSTMELIMIHDHQLHQTFTEIFPTQVIDQAILIITNMLKIILGLAVVLLICDILLVIGIILHRRFLLLPWITFNSFLCIIIFHFVLVLAFYLSGSTIHNLSTDNILLAMVLYTSYWTYTNLLVIQASETF